MADLLFAERDGNWEKYIYPKIENHLHGRNLDLCTDNPAVIFLEGRPALKVSIKPALLIWELSLLNQSGVNSKTGANDGTS